MKNKTFTLSSFTQGIIILSFSPPEQIPIDGDYYGYPTNITIIDNSSGKQYHEIYTLLQESSFLIECPIEYVIPSHTSITMSLFFDEDVNDNVTAVEDLLCDTDVSRGVAYCVRKYIRKVGRFITDAFDEVQYQYQIDIPSNYIVCQEILNRQVPNIVNLVRKDIYKDQITQLGKVV